MKRIISIIALLAIVFTINGLFGQQLPSQNDRITSKSIVYYSQKDAAKVGAVKAIMSGLAAVTVSSPECIDEEIKDEELPFAKATYFHPTVGMDSQNNGACMVNIDCGSSHTYYDNGGAAANYSNGINQVYRTFCPDTPGKCVRAQVVSMDIENNGASSCYDRLWVINGATQNNPFLWEGCRTNATPTTLTGSWNGGVWVGNNSSGCLGFRFYSDGTDNRAGWNITLDCVDCVSADQSSNNDCSSAQAICDVTSFSGSSPGPGLSSVCSGCNISENYSSWYYFEITADGTLGITIDPDDPNDDYDFALYDGSQNCSSLGAPLRCSWAEGIGSTGMGNSALDNSEDVYGDGWVSTLSVTAGDAYYLLINNWTPSGTGFEISFQWSGGAGADCSIVPVEMLSFDGQCSNDKTKLQWATASELNNDFFTIMKSGNGITFKTIGWVMGAGTSNELNFYSFTDEEENDKPMYYQLKQTDFNGEFSYSKMILVECGQITEFNLTVADNSESGYIEALFNAVPNVQYMVSLVDATGRTVYSNFVSGDDFIRHKISTEPLSQGIYVLNVHSQANSHSQKVMIGSK
jgi:hypothetical protein